MYVYTRFKDAILSGDGKRERFWSASIVRVCPIRWRGRGNSILTNCYPFDTVHPKLVSFYVSLPPPNILMPCLNKKIKIIIIILRVTVSRNTEFNVS